MIKWYLFCITKLTLIYKSRVVDIIPKPPRSTFGKIN
jgi:hypothetical protein